jgi:hypothetical protein
MGDGLADAAAIDPAQWRDSLASIDRVWVVSGFLDENPKFVDTGSAVVPDGRTLCTHESFGTAAVSQPASDPDYGRAKRHAASASSHPAVRVARGWWRPSW